MYSSKAIVLHHIRYGESSIIVKIYTLEKGLQSFIIKGFHAKNSRQKKALYLPLTLLEIQAQQGKGDTLSYIREARIDYPYRQIYAQVEKSTVALFLAQMLQKCVNENESDPLLFRFVYENLIHFDQAEKDYADFHILFLIELTSYLGIALPFEQWNISFPLCAQDRSDILKQLLQHYQLHLPQTQNLQALDILHEVFTF